MTRSLLVSALAAVFLMGGVLPMVSHNAAAWNMGNLNPGQLNSGWLTNFNPSDTWDVWESVGNYIAVFMKPDTDFDLRMHQNTGGAGAVLVTSANLGTSPELCVWNGNGVALANQRSAAVYSTGASALPNGYDIEYEVSSTISPNSVLSSSFSNNNMLTLVQVYLSAGVTYTFKFNSVSNGNADYRFSVFKPNAGVWNNLGNALGNGGYNPVSGYTTCSIAPAASAYYGVAIMKYNSINTNYQFVVGAPDLTVTGISISPSPVVIGGVSLMPQNRPFTFTATVYNQGYGDAGQFSVASYDDGVLWNTLNHLGLTARTSMSSGPVSYNTANPDTQVLSVWADSANQVAEDGPSGTATAEGNNWNSRTDAVAEVRSAYTNDADDTVPSPAGYSYYYYAYYFNAGDSQRFSLWNPSPNTDLDMYLYGPTGTLVATAASTDYPERFTYSSPSGGYHYIQVLRASGAGSGFTFSVDNANPTLQVVQPADDAYLLGNYELRLNCMDQGSGISSASPPAYRVDGGSWVTLTQTVQVGYNYVVTLATAGLRDGSHTLEYMAWDNAANFDYAKQSLTVDNTPPSSCALVYPLASQFVEDQLTIKVSASDQIGMAGVSLLFGGGLSGLGTQSAALDRNTGYWQYQLDTKAYNDGSVSVAPTASDQAGNTKSQAATFFIIDNNPPTLSVTSPADSGYLAGNAVSISAAASDAAGTLSVRYKIDGGSWYDMSPAGGSYTATWDSTTVPDAPHRITVRATDGAGHVTEQVLAVVIDNTAPACALVSPSPGQYVEGRFLFKVSAWDSNGIHSVNLTIGGVGTFAMAYNSVDDLFEMELDTSLYSDGAYSLSVNVTDNGAHHGLRAATQLTLGSPGFYIDNVAPSLALGSPQNMAMVKGIIALSINTLDTPTAPSVDYGIDGVSWAPMAAGADNLWTASWNSVTVPDGTHTITFRSRGQLGHIATLTITVVVDNNSPSLYWGAPDESSFLSGIFTIKVKAIDGVGIRSVVLEVGDRNYPMTLNTGSGYYEYPLDTTALPDGEWNLTVTVSELSGLNPDSVSVRTVRIDNNYPELHLTSPVQGEVVSGQCDFTLDASDRYLRAVEYKVDSLGWAPVSGGWDTTRHPDGIHTVTLRATDLTGRFTEMGLTVTVDNSLPVCAFAAPTNDSFVSGTALIQLRAFDSAGLASVSLSGEGARPFAFNSANGMYEAELNTRALEDGVYLYTANCTDLFGRTSIAFLRLNVDNSPPDLSVSFPADGASLAGMLTVLADATDAFPTSLEYQVDNLGWRPASASLDTSLLADGAHGLAVRATDESGRVSTVQLLIVLDNTPPLVSVLEPSASGISLCGRLNLRVAVGEPQGIREIYYSLDGGPLMPMIINRATGYFEETIDTRALSDTVGHNLTIKVTSDSGLVTNFTREFRVDNTPPAVKVLSPSAEAQKGAVSIVVGVTDATGVSEVMIRIDGGQWQEMMVSKTPGQYEFKWSTGVSQNGEHTFEIRTTDSLGNKGTTVYKFKVDNPDYSWVIMLAIVVLIAVTAVALFVRRRKKRTAEFTAPDSEPPMASPVEAGTKEFPQEAPIPEPEKAPVQPGPYLADPESEDEARAGELDQSRAPKGAARAPTPLEELTANLKRPGS